jgi:hypothetical protein
MTSFNRGDVVLVKFVFTDEKGVKQRPGLIVSADKYQQVRREAIFRGHHQQPQAASEPLKTSYGPSRAPWESATRALLGEIL